MIMIIIIIIISHPKEVALSFSLTFALASSLLLPFRLVVNYYQISTQLARTTASAAHSFGSPPRGAIDIVCFR